MGYCDNLRATGVVEVVQNRVDGVLFAWSTSYGVFGRFDLAALCGCHTLNVCYVMLCGIDASSVKTCLTCYA